MSDERIETRATLPVTVYAVAAVYRRPDGNMELFCRMFSRPGLVPVSDAEAVAIKTAEIEAELPGFARLGAVAAHVTVKGTEAV